MKIAVWNVRGLCKASRQKEVRDIIKEENISMCSVLETHVMKDKVGFVVKKVFRNWEWCAYAVYCERGCRIITGWDKDVIRVMVINQTIKPCYILLKPLMER